MGGMEAGLGRGQGAAAGGGAHWRRQQQPLRLRRRCSQRQWQPLQGAVGRGRPYAALYSTPARVCVADPNGQPRLGWVRLLWRLRPTRAGTVITWGMGVDTKIPRPPLPSVTPWVTARAALPPTPRPPPCVAPTAWKCRKLSSLFCPVGWGGQWGGRWKGGMWALLWRPPSPRRARWCRPAWRGGGCLGQPPLL